METPIEVRADPRIELNQEDYAAKTKLLLDLRELLSQTNVMINNTNTYKAQLTDLKEKLESNKTLDETLSGAIDGAMKKISDLQDDILKRPPPAMNYRQRPRIREEIRSVMRAVNGAWAKPTQPQFSRLEQLKGEVNQAKATLNQIIGTDIKGINEKTKNIPQISVGNK